MIYRNVPPAATKRKETFQFSSWNNETVETDELSLVTKKVLGC